MTKADIINQITLTTGLQKRDVAVVIESFMETVKDSLLEKRENVYLRGFGIAVKEADPRAVMTSYNLLNRRPKLKSPRPKNPTTPEKS